MKMPFRPVDLLLLASKVGPFGVRTALHTMAGPLLAALDCLPRAMFTLLAFPCHGLFPAQTPLHPLHETICSLLRIKGLHCSNTQEARPRPHCQCDELLASGKHPTKAAQGGAIFASSLSGDVRHCQPEARCSSWWLTAELESFTYQTSHSPPRPEPLARMLAAALTLWAVCVRGCDGASSPPQRNAQRAKGAVRSTLDDDARHPSGCRCPTRMSRKGVGISASKSWSVLGRQSVYHASFRLPTVVPLCRLATPCLLQITPTHMLLI